jgi:outer membrane protein TolC
MIMITQILCILLLLTGSSIQSEDAVVQPAENVITQQEAIDLALANNPDLHVSLDQLKAIENRIAQAGEYPSTSFDIELDQTKLVSDFNEAYYGISQLIEYPTRRGLRISLAKEEVKVSESEYDQIRWELTLAVKTVYQRLALSQHQVELSRENVAISEKLLQLAQSRFNAGSVSKLDVVRAQVEAANASDELLMYENEERDYRMQLNYLLGREAAAPVRTTPLVKGIEVKEGADELSELALTKRIEFRSLENRRSAAAVKQTLARSSYYPDFSAGFYRHQLSGDMDSWKINFGIVIPIFGRGAIEGRVAEAKAEEKTVLTEVSARRSLVENEVRSAFKDLTALSERAKLYQEDILAKAEEAFRIAEATYREGEIDNLELLLSQKTLQEVRRRCAEILFAYNMGLINLERAVGSELEKESKSSSGAD